MREVLNTAHHVSGVSAHVRINKEAVADFSKGLRASGSEAPPWNRIYHFCGGGQDTVTYLLVLDSINFCFWSASERTRWEVEFGSRRLSGYYALAAALTHAIESGVPLTNAEYLAQLTLDNLRQILDGHGELPLLEDRVRNLNELGRFLVEEYEGEASGLVEAAAGSAEKLVGLLVENLPSFRDIGEYLGQRVYFYKRAQIFCADLYGSFKGRRWGQFRDIDRLTAFADYKLPQVLRHLGIMHYDEALAEKVDRKVLLEAGGPEEIEIRANTIWAVELIRRELSSLGRPLRAFEVDWILWNLGQQVEFKTRPHHRTVTIFY